MNCWTRIILALMLGALAALLVSGYDGAATGTSPQSPASRRASDPAATSQPARYPPRTLRAACNARAGTLRTELDETFHVRVDPPFVVAGNGSPAALARYADSSVRRPAAALWRG
ncbi:MAG: hypothetical protein ACOC93_03410, partial [Planctomycetota bacterium]